MPQAADIRDGAFNGHGYLVHYFLRRRPRIYGDHGGNREIDVRDHLHVEGESGPDGSQGDHGCDKKGEPPFVQRKFGQKTRSNSPCLI